MTCLNELTQTPSNNLPERFYMDARMTETKPQGRARQTSYTNVHKANLGLKLSIFYTGLFAWAHPRLNDLSERVDTDAPKWPTRTILHGCPHDQNEGTRERRVNELHKHAQNQPPVTT